MLGHQPKVRLKTRRRAGSWPRRSPGGSGERLCRALRCKRKVHEERGSGFPEGFHFGASPRRSRKARAKLPGVEIEEEAEAQQHGAADGKAAGVLMKHREGMPCEVTAGDQSKAGGLGLLLAGGLVRCAVMRDEAIGGREQRHTVAELRQADDMVRGHLIPAEAAGGRFADGEAGLENAFMSAA